MLNTADVCVNPDVANEMNDISTMNKIMEYMALGKPIVQFDLAEGRFSAQRGLALCAAQRRRSTSARKIVELLDDPGAARRRWATSAAGACEDELEWRHEAPKLLAAYEALWGAAGHVRPRPA